MLASISRTCRSTSLDADGRPARLDSAVCCNARRPRVEAITRRFVGRADEDRVSVSAQATVDQRGSVGEYER